MITFVIAAVVVIRSSKKMELATALARLDAIPVLIESLKSHYPESHDIWYCVNVILPFAKNEAEQLVVAVEEGKSKGNTYNLCKRLRCLELIEKKKPESSGFFLDDESSGYFLDDDRSSVVTHDIENTELAILIMDSCYTLNKEKFFSLEFHVVMNSICSNICRFGCLELLEILLQLPYIDPSNEEYNCLLNACIGGHVKVVDRLLTLETRCDPSIGSNTCFITSCCRDHVDVARRLLADPRVNPSALDNYAIKIASRAGHKEIVKMIKADKRCTLNFFQKLFY